MHRVLEHIARMSAVSVLLIATLLSGCVSSEDQLARVGLKPPSEEVKLQINEIAASETSLRRFFSNRTFKVYEPLHGTQIEYFASNGRAYLWYPGNTAAVPSLWKVQLTTARPEVCFQYPKNSYNPVTAEFGGAWECRPARLSIYTTDELRDGDMFELATGKLPFVMPRATDLSMAEAMARSGRTRSLGKNHVTWSWRSE